MTKKYILLLLLAFIFYGCSAQPKITETQKLESLARVWGFLKYYHPNVAGGQFNWDYELMKKVPKVVAAQTREELSQVYLNWIDSLGIIDESKPSIRQDTFDKNFNLSWTDDKSIFNKSLIQKLDYIENNRFQGNSHYVTADSTGLLYLTNEDSYPGLNFEYPDEAHRLLNLFRFWNIVEYFFAYKYLTDQNWNDVLTEMIPKFRDAQNQSEYQLAVLEMVAKVDDSHAYITRKLAPSVFGYYWIPAAFKIIDGKAVILEYYNESLAVANDIRIGDVIHAVEGEPIERIISRKSKYVAASNQATRLRDYTSAIFNGETDEVTIMYERDGVLKEKQVKRYLGNEIKYKIPEENQKWEVLAGNIGYVNMGILEIPDVAAMMERLMECEAIIFDVRNYPKGTMDEISKYLNPEPRPYAKFILSDLTYPGKFYWHKGYSAGKHNSNPYKGKVVILVNEHTQSHAEFTVMALQTADNTKVIGSQTAGADGNIIPFKLVGNYETSITGVGVYYPDGRETQRIGIVPDIEVKPTIEGVKNGKDEVLAKALEYIEEKEKNLLITPLQ